MFLTASHYLDIYRWRKSCQDEGVTNPSKTTKAFTATLVQLEALDDSELIDLRKTERGTTQFAVVSSGEVLAEWPNHEH